MTKRSFSMLRLAAFATAAAALAGFVTPAAAQQVKLTSIDTGFVLTGELLEFTDGNYVIKSSIGQLTIDSRQVECAGPGCPNSGPVFSASVGVFGSDMIGSALMPGLIEAYSETQNSVVERQIGADATQVVMRLLSNDGSEVAAIDLRSNSSANAFPGLISGAAAIGMSSRPVTQTEVAALAQAGIEGINSAGQEHILALDGLIIVVSRDNPLRTISTTDLTDIFSGAIDNWAALGGPDAPINVYMREPGSGAYDIFSSMVLESQGEALTPRAQFFRTSRGLSDAVAADVNAIGVTGIAFERNSRALALETTCGLVIEPSEFNVKTEEYPLSRRLFLYTTGASLAPSAKGLLEFALSDEAQGQIADLGFVN
ncbi:MAG: substrate-binding domain-containing protein, partial [Pikeienuella sp.]